MRIITSFKSSQPIILPINHQEIIQGFIYSSLDPDIADFLHNNGFAYGKRKFKLFTFSRLLGQVKKEKDSFKFFPPVKLVVSSIYFPMIESLATNFVKREELLLGNNVLQLRSIEVEKEFKSEENEITIKMLSPVTVYSTLSTPEGRKKTYFYNPYEDEFSDLVARNIVHKFVAFYGREPQETQFSIKPLIVSKKDEKLIKYKGTIIKGWMGIYKLTGNPELLKLAYYTGIGSKNSQGFGCFEIITFPK